MSTCPIPSWHVSNVEGSFVLINLNTQISNAINPYKMLMKLYPTWSERELNIDRTIIATNIEEVSAMIKREGKKKFLNAFTNFSEKTVLISDLGSYQKQNKHLLLTNVNEN